MEWAFGPFFVSGVQNEAMGYELVGVEFQTGGKGGGLLRVYIDSEAGISAEDCRQVSYQVSGVLDVEDPIPGHYTLEISSPGLDRLLFRQRDFERFAGKLIKLRTAYPIEGQRKFKGRLIGMQGENVVFEQDDMEISLPFDQIEQARLVPEY
jgi:ribosome maturation factor RimP